MACLHVVSSHVDATIVVLLEREGSRGGILSVEIPLLPFGSSLAVLCLSTFVVPCANYFAGYSVGAVVGLDVYVLFVLQK